MNWPIGLGGKGNEGVTQQVKQTEGAIGYVELIYALSQQAAVRRDQERRRATFVDAHRWQSVTAAAASAKFAQGHRFPGVDHQRPGRRRLPDLVVHLAAGAQRTTKDAAKAKLLKDFLTWMITPEAQQMAADAAVRAAPAEVVPLIEPICGPQGGGSRSRQLCTAPGRERVPAFRRPRCSLVRRTP